MAAPLSGLDGTVTYACGYTTLVRGWAMSINAAPQDLTPLNPAGDHQQLLTSGLLQGASGSYGCRLAVGPVANFGAGVGEYDTYPEEWAFMNTCEAREVTTFQATWRSFLPGLKTTTIQMVSYIDDTQALPLTGQAATATLIVDGARSYSVPYVVLGNDSGVDVDDSMRRVITVGAGSEAPGRTGSLPLAGTECLITLYAGGTNRKYVTAALVTGVAVSVNRRASIGSVAVAFVANGVVTTH